MSEEVKLQDIDTGSRVDKVENPDAQDTPEDLDAAARMQELKDNESIFNADNSSMFNPDVEIGITHPQRPGREIVIRGKYFDVGGSVLLEDTGMIDTLLRWKKIGDIDAEAVKEMSEEEIKDLLSPDAYFTDTQRMDYRRAWIFAYCTKEILEDGKVVMSGITPTEVKHHFTRGMIEKIYKIFTEGVTTGSSEDVVDRFSYEIKVK